MALPLLQPGDPAPDFALPAVNREGQVSLGDYRGRSPVLVGLFRGLHAEGNPWISLHRNHRPDEFDAPTQEINGTNELLMRNQFRAWAHYMTLDMAQ